MCNKMPHVHMLALDISGSCGAKGEASAPFFATLNAIAAVIADEQPFL